MQKCKSLLEQRLLSDLTAYTFNQLNLVVRKMDFGLRTYLVLLCAEADPLIQITVLGSC